MFVLPTKIAPASISRDNDRRRPLGHIAISRATGGRRITGDVDIVFHGKGNAVQRQRLSSRRSGAQSLAACAMQLIEAQQMNPDRQIARSRKPVPQVLNHLCRRKGSGSIPIRERRQIKTEGFRRLALQRFRLPNKLDRSIRPGCKHRPPRSKIDRERDSREHLAGLAFASRIPTRHCMTDFDRRPDRNGRWPLATKWFMEHGLRPTLC